MTSSPSSSIPALVYSSGAFLDPNEPLETAQRRKLDLICRKLQLRPGQRFLDIGCGWGALAIHAARHYDVRVLGVTLSGPQVDLATTMAADAGVGDQVTFKVLDYRDVQGRFDAIASVGMFEHVGKSQLGRYFTRVGDLLEPDGTFLNHGIVIRDRRRRRVKPTFVNTYVNRLLRGIAMLSSDTISCPFAKPEANSFAVQVINHYDDEVPPESSKDTLTAASSSTRLN